MEEFKIISGSMSDCQKWLNQWRHEYEITVIQMCLDGGSPVILLKRKKKGI